MNDDIAKPDDKPQPSDAPRGLNAVHALAGGALIIAAIVAYTAWHTRVDFQARLDTLAGALETTNAERQRLAAEIDVLRRNGADQLAAASRAEAERKALASDLADLKGRMNRSPVTFDAAIAEAEYLAFLAVRRVTEDYDPAGAAAALQSADGLLAATNRSELAALREQIARDREALAAVSVPDVHEIAQTLTRAEHDVEALPFREVGTASAASPASAPSGGWRGALSEMWRGVLGLVEVRDAAPGDEVLLDPARRGGLRQDLRQELAVAKYAALRRDNVDFRAAIGVVQAALKSVFNTGDAAVAALVSRLDEAKALDLAPPLPAIGGSLEAIRAWRATAAAAEGAAVRPAQQSKTAAAQGAPAAPSEPATTEASAPATTAGAEGAAAGPAAEGTPH